MSRKKRLRNAWMIVGVIILGSALFVSANLRLRRGKPLVPDQPVEGVSDKLKRDLPPGVPDVRFTDVARRAGIGFVHSNGKRTSMLPEDMGSGAAWGDYDNDGNLDLYIVNHAGPWSPDFHVTPDMPANALYHNNGDGTFTDMAQKAGVDLRAFGMGVAWGDYDADGYPDLYVTNVGGNVLFHNDGNGRFTDVTARTGVKGGGFGATAIWNDFDGDGWLDIYVTNYVEFVFDPNDYKRGSSQWGYSLPFTINPSSYKPARNLFFRNNHDGTFTEIARKLGVDNPTGRSLSASSADLDNNGWPDIYIANDISASALFLNERGRKFVNRGAQAWIAEYRGSMGLAIGDVDFDGDLDVFISHWLGQENSLYRNLLLENGGKELHFTDIADMVGLGAVALPFVGWGAEFFDMDNNGELDVAVVNGSTLQDSADPTQLVPQKNFLFWKKGAEGFFDIGDIAGPAFTEPNVGRGLAVADYDNDGLLDLLVTRNHGPAMLLHNETKTQNHWLTVRLHGPKGNPTGTGARVRLSANGRTALREAGTSPSYLSQHSPDLHFGLGSTTTIESLEVTWPHGPTQKWSQVPIDRMTVVEYGRTELKGSAK